MAPDTAGSAGQDRITSSAARLRCPVHDMPDCSPLLNGCILVLRLHDYDRPLVDGAIEGVADTYTAEGVPIWWESWLRQDPDGRVRRLQQAHGYGGMVAT